MPCITLVYIYMYIGVLNFASVSACVYYVSMGMTDELTCKYNVWGVYMYVCMGERCVLYLYLELGSLQFLSQVCNLLCGVVCILFHREQHILLHVQIHTHTHTHSVEEAGASNGLR